VLGPITDAVSNAVRAQYEENPYPRWLCLDQAPPVPPAQWLSAQLGSQAPAGTPSALNVLIAGCGTGRDAIALATEMSGVRVTAIDLSLSSLAYARRKARKRGLGNIEFCQADLLGLGELREQFDLIYCVGVLHHMSDPQAGLRALLRLGTPRGLLKLGLYSERARSDLRAARAIIRSLQVPAAEAQIRAFRQHILALPVASPLKRLLRYRDFFSMSECRDLLFHVQDHEFRLPQVARMLDEHGLTVLGMSQPLPRQAALAYREMYPGDEAMADLERWDAVESRYPEAFSGMYQIWCRLPGA
jgi:2-polyprenyl-3-methyl-5-hydroxy-6-metoxy-1,4-benzoquinol methylase